MQTGKKCFPPGFASPAIASGNEGGGVGPDLTNLAKRSDYKSMLESTIHPNMVVSNQFEQHELTMKDGSLSNRKNCLGRKRPLFLGAIWSPTH